VPPKPDSHPNVVGLIPAAGQATRIAPLPCSKELYPIGFRAVDGGSTLRPKVACHYVLEKMRLAGITRAYFVLRNGKWDIPAYLGDGSIVNMHLAYLMMRLPFGPPYTLDQAYPFVKDSVVAFGFPDIIFEPDDAFARLLDRQAATRADLVLGLFPADRPQTTDMVEIDDDGRVRSILIQPRATDLRYAWIIAVWTPVFTGFMHEYLSRPGDVSDRPELSVGQVFQAAIREGLTSQAMVFPNEPYLDIGSPDHLVKAVCDASANAGLLRFP